MSQVRLNQMVGWFYVKPDVILKMILPHHIKVSKFIIGTFLKTSH